jgi:hypothetical protein
MFCRFPKSIVVNLRAIITALPLVAVTLAIVASTHLPNIVLPAGSNWG